MNLLSFIVNLKNNYMFFCFNIVFRSDIFLFQSGKIAMHLDLVSHQIRERLDEIKRQEIQRLRNLAREKMKAMNGTQLFTDMLKQRGMKKKSWVIFLVHSAHWVELLPLITHH